MGFLGDRILGDSLELIISSFKSMENCSYETFSF